VHRRDTLRVSSCEPSFGLPIRVLSGGFDHVLVILYLSSLIACCTGWPPRASCPSSILSHLNGTSNSVESMPQTSIHLTLSLLTLSICLTGPALLAFMLFSCPLGISGLPLGG